MAIILKKQSAASTTTPAAGKVTFFVDNADGLPKYKDDVGATGNFVGPQGSQGAQGPQPSLSSSIPSSLIVSGAGAAGAGVTASKGDHSHPMPGLSTNNTSGFMSASQFNKLSNSCYDVKADYGAVGDGFTDDTTAIQNAINAAQSAGGGIVFFPKGRFKITSTLNITGNGITLQGSGASYTTDVGTYSLAGASWIVWGAGNSSIAVKAAPVTGASNQSLIGFQFKNLSIDCRNNDSNQATIGLQVLSAHGFHIEDFFIIDSITAALDLGVVTPLGEARDCTRGLIQRGCIRVLDGASAGSIGIRLDGDSTANTCCNEFRTIQIMHVGTSGNPGIECLNSDSNTFTNVYVNRASGTNNGIRLNGSNSAATLVARNNVFYNCSAGIGGVVSRATALTFPALDNYFHCYQVGNGEPIPTIETGSSLYFSANGTQNGGAFSTFLGNIPNIRLNANFTTTVVTNTNTNLQFYVQPNEIWKIYFKGTAQCSGTGGSKYQITAPSGATIEGWLESTTTTITTISKQRFTAINTLNATAVHTVTTTPAPDSIEVVIVNGATGGIVSIGAASVTAGQTTTIFAGSSLEARKMSNV